MQYHAYDLLGFGLRHLKAPKKYATVFENWENSNEIQIFALCRLYRSGKLQQLLRQLLRCCSPSNIAHKYACSRERSREWGWNFLFSTRLPNEKTFSTLALRWLEKRNGTELNRKTRNMHKVKHRVNSGSENGVKTGINGVKRAAGPTNAQTARNLRQLKMKNCKIKTENGMMLTALSTRAPMLTSTVWQAPSGKRGPLPTFFMRAKSLKGYKRSSAKSQPENQTRNQDPGTEPETETEPWRKPASRKEKEMQKL